MHEHDRRATRRVGLRDLLRLVVRDARHVRRANYPTACKPRSRIASCRADRALRDRALLRALGVPRRADALEQRLRVADGRRAARAGARRARAPARAAPRLHRGAWLAGAARGDRGRLRALAAETCSRSRRPRRASSRHTTRCLAPGDHVIVETPCYGSAIELARSTGADVSLWQRRYEDGWAHDLDELERLLRPETRLVYINSPHNPTGTQMPRATLRATRRARRRALDRAVQRRGLPGPRARPRPAPACRLRRLRRARSRSAPSPRRTACPACASAGSPAASLRCSRASRS